MSDLTTSGDPHSFMRDKEFTRISAGRNPSLIDFSHRANHMAALNYVRNHSAPAFYARYVDTSSITLATSVFAAESAHQQSNSALRCFGRKP